MPTPLIERIQACLKSVGLADVKGIFWDWENFDKFEGIYDEDTGIIDDNWVIYHFKGRLDSLYIYRYSDTRCPTFTDIMIQVQSCNQIFKKRIKICSVELRPLTDIVTYESARYADFLLMVTFERKEKQDVREH